MPSVLCKFGDFRCLKDIPPERIAKHVIDAVEHNAEHKTKHTKLAKAREAAQAQEEKKD